MHIDFNGLYFHLCFEDFSNNFIYVAHNAYTCKVQEKYKGHMHLFPLIMLMSLDSSYFLHIGSHILVLHILFSFSSFAGKQVYWCRSKLGCQIQ